MAFNERTEFSQQKYMLKKTKKHSDRVLILKPNVRLLAECYYKRSPDRVAHLRFFPEFIHFLRLRSNFFIRDVKARNSSATVWIQNVASF